MKQPRHPYFFQILEELSKLDRVVPRSLFGHEGFAFATSVFAILDTDHIFVKSSRYVNPEVALPKGFVFFMPNIFQRGEWVGIPIDDSLAALRKHWPLVQESYQLAVQRELAKTKVKNRQPKKGV